MDAVNWSDTDEHSGEQLLVAYAECLRQVFRPVSEIGAQLHALAVREAQDFQGWLIARLDGKLPPFKLGDKVEPTTIPLFSDGGSNATAMHKRDIFTISGVFYAGRGGDIWSISLEELPLADVNPHERPVRFPARYFKRIDVL